MWEVLLKFFVGDIFVGVCVFPREPSVPASNFLSKELGMNKVVFKGEIFVKAIDGSKAFFFLSKVSPTHKLFSCQSGDSPTVGVPRVMYFVRGLQDCLVKLALSDALADPRIFFKYSVV